MDEPERDPEIPECGYFMVLSSGTNRMGNYWEKRRFVNGYPNDNTYFYENVNGNRHWCNPDGSKLDILKDGTRLLTVPLPTPPPSPQPRLLAFPKEEEDDVKKEDPDEPPPPPPPPPSAPRSLVSSSECDCKPCRRALATPPTTPEKRREVRTTKKEEVEIAIKKEEEDVFGPRL